MSEHPPAAGCPVCARLAQLLATSLAAAITAIAAWLLVCRLAGSFGAAPSGLTLLATSLALAGTSFLVRQLAGLDRAFVKSPLGRAVWLAPGCAWALLGLALATFAASGVGVAVFWLAFSFTEIEAWLREGRPLLAHGLSAALPRAANAVAAPVEPHAPAPASPAAPVAEVEGPAAAPSETQAELPEGVSLQLTRQQTARGELIFGAARAIFAPGQRIATVHVAFGAPLAALPEVLAEPRGEVEVAIDCVQALAHGARFDLRLPRAAPESTVVVFDFEAYVGPAETAAA